MRYYVVFLTLVAGIATALVPNFNLNTGRRLARFAQKNGYTLNQLENATANNAINVMEITDPNITAALTVGWVEIQAEAVRMWHKSNPTEDEVTNVEILALIRAKYPNATVTKVVGDDKWIVDKDGIE